MINVAVLTEPLNSLVATLTLGLLQDRP